MEPCNSSRAQQIELVLKRTHTQTSGEVEHVILRTYWLRFADTKKCLYANSEKEVLVKSFNGSRVGARFLEKIKYETDKTLKIFLAS